MKYCVDCKWFQRGEFEREDDQIKYGLCLNPHCEPSWFNEPDGTAYLGNGVEQQQAKPPSARLLRNWRVRFWNRVFNTGYVCGPQARFWEPKP